MSTLPLPSEYLVGRSYGVRTLPTARDYPRHPTSGLTVVIHYWMWAVIWTWLVMAAASVVYGVEKVLFINGLIAGRAAFNPALFSAQFFGLAHYTVAIYFLFTSKSIRSLRGMSMLLLYTSFALFACYLLNLAGGPTNMLAIIAVFIFFLAHGLRDETFFYRQRAGKAITDDEYPHAYRMLVRVQVLGLGLMGAILYPFYIFKLYGDPRHAYVTEFVYAVFPASWPLAFKAAIITLPFLSMCVLAVWRIQRNHTGGLVHLLKSHKPLAVILAGYVLVGASLPIFGFWLVFVLILLHFTGWFVFAHVGLANQTAEQKSTITWRTPNLWIRKNCVGFWVFHGGLAVLFLVLILIESWMVSDKTMVVGGMELSHPLTMICSRQSFYYLTLFHITLAFIPKPAPQRG